MRRAGGLYGPDWLPSDVDFLKSRLFWRLRSGKSPLKAPPPCAYSCPWYEVVEDIRPHWCYLDFRVYPNGVNDDGVRPIVAIAQTAYELVEKTEQGYLVRFGPWQFDVWRGLNNVPQLNLATGRMEERMVAGCWIQRRLEAGETA